MRNELFGGVMLGFAYAAPIGAQNIFVISQSLEIGFPKNFLMASLVAIIDFSLAVVCVMGLGNLLNEMPLIRNSIGFMGGAYLIYLAVVSLSEIGKAAELELTGNLLPWRAIVLRAFVLTWLNPHALLDGTALLGTYASTLQSQSKVIFLIGVGSASLTWFLTVSLVGSSLKNSNSRWIVESIKAFSGMTIMYFGISIIAETASGLMGRYL